MQGNAQCLSHKSLQTCFLLYTKTQSLHQLGMAELEGKKNVSNLAEKNTYHKKPTTTQIKMKLSKKEMN